MPADVNTLKYRALLDISEAFIACRDYHTLLRTLWDSLHDLIRFDYLALVRYDEQEHRGWLEAIAGTDTPSVPLQTDMPLAGSPMQVLLESRGPLYIANLSLETRFRPDLMKTVEQYGIRSGFWVPLVRSDRWFGSLSFASQTLDAYGGDERGYM